MLNLDYSFLNWGVIQSFIAKGFWFSIQLTLVAMIGGIILGTLLAMMRLSSHKWLSSPAAFYVDTLRSIARDAVDQREVPIDRVLGLDGAQAGRRVVWTGGASQHGGSDRHGAQNAGAPRCDRSCATMMRRRSFAIEAVFFSATSTTTSR